MAISGTFRHEWLLEDITNLRDRAKTTETPEDLEHIMMLMFSKVNHIVIRQYISQLWTYSTQKMYPFADIQNVFVKTVDEELLP